MNPPTLDELLRDLTGKQRAFVHHYLKNGFNATRAAQQAGYTGEENTLAVTGSRTLRNAKVQAAITAHLSEHAMSAEEALWRLAQIARANIDDIVDHDGNLDMDKARKLGVTHLIKEVFVHRHTTYNDGGSSETVQHRVKLHDAKAALDSILRAAGAFRDVLEHQGIPAGSVNIYIPDNGRDDTNEGDEDEG